MSLAKGRRGALSDMLSEELVAAFFSSSAFAKARAYQAEGRVSGLKIDAESQEIRASVRGSHRTPYQVDIYLDWDGDTIFAIDGDCSCPISLNCKHVAATLLEIVNGDGAVSAPVAAAHNRRPGNVSSQKPPALAYDVIAWLDKIGTAARGNDYPGDVTQRLLYRLSPAFHGGGMPRLDISLLSARVAKGGGFGKDVKRPSGYRFSADHAPKYFRDCDIAIVTRLSDHLDINHFSHQPVTAELLREIVQTGRAYWLEDLERPPLRWGEARTGRLEWRYSGKQTIAPHLVVAGTITLNDEPPIYVDVENCLVGPVEQGLPPRLSYQLLSAPPIPRSQIGEVSRRLSQTLPSEHHGFLPAAPVAAIPIQEDPVPLLRLTLVRMDTHGYFYRDRPDRMPLARLSFRYGPIEIDLFERANAVEAFLDGQIYAVARRRSKEKGAVKQLTDLGFVAARSVYPFLDGHHAHDLTFAKSHDWLSFLNLHVARLRADGFEVRIDDSFPYRLAESSGTFDAEFESSGIDWFDLTLGVEIEGERHDLAPLLAALVVSPDFSADRAKQLAEKDEHFFLPLADGRHVALAASRFLPLILALHDLRLSGVFLDATRKIRLSRADIVPLLEHEREDFTFRGADGVRHLGQLLQTRGLTAPQLPDGFRAELRPYQGQGVAWLELLRESGLGGVLADDMGLGKTVQVLALLALEKARGHLDRPSLVVAPTSLMTNWVDEARKFVPDLKVLVLQGAARKQNFSLIGEHDVVLSTYPLIARDQEILLTQDWHMVILDEAQTVKNPNAATSRLLRGIKARHRFCLTGTPMENHLGELWSIMNFVNPGYLGDKTEFARRWRNPIEKHGDAARSVALARRVKPFLLRRTKAEVAAELPPKTEIVERVSLEGSQRDLYDSIRLSMSDKVRKAIQERGLAKSHIVVLEALLRLRQTCCDPALLKLKDRVARPSAKLDRLMEMVLELLSEGRKIIVFSQFTSMIDLIRVRLDAAHIRYELLTGRTTDRKSAINAFQTGVADIFLISLKAGGVGLNLTAADTVIIFDPWWNPAVEEQAIDRAHRIGQDKPVFVYRLVAEGSIEEKMDALKARKRALADGLFSSDGTIGSALTEADVRMLFDE